MDRRHCTCHYPEPPGNAPAPSGRTVAAIHGQEDALVAPLLLETDGHCDILPLAAERRRKPAFAGYTKVEIAVDSGAAASAMPEHCLSQPPRAP